MPHMFLLRVGEPTHEGITALGDTVTAQILRVGTLAPVVGAKHPDRASGHTPSVDRAALGRNRPLERAELAAHALAAEPGVGGAGAVRALEQPRHAQRAARVLILPAAARDVARVAVAAFITNRE